MGGGFKAQHTSDLYVHAQFQTLVELRTLVMAPMGELQAVGMASNSLFGARRIPARLFI